MASAAAPSSSSEPDLGTLRSKLNKKSDFEGAAQECIHSLERIPTLADAPQFKGLLRRAFTVLRSRCGAADTALWAAGRDLVLAAHNATAAEAGAAYLQELAGYEAQCEQVLGEQPEVPTAAASRGGALFEGQLSGEGDGMQPLSDPLMDYASRLFAAHLPQQTGAAGDGPGQGSGELPPPAAVPAMSEAEAEALQRQLDIIAVQIMEDTGQEAPRAAPPASKAAVRSLPRETVTEERWQELGGGEARCPVCFCCDPGDEIMVLPCKHWAHPACMAPWLAERNSCPTCRHELPTDDSAYERRKQREAEEEEESRGAANAVTHNEFLYI